MITVFADQHLFRIREIVPDCIDLRFYNPEEGLPKQLDQADALLVRTVSEINEQTLSPVPDKLRFVGTGSAGTDHVDTDFLTKHGIRAAYSAGCNARSVAEYVVTGLLLWSNHADIDLRNETIGIVGAGHVGTALQQMLDDLGWQYKLYDPPRAERDSSFQSVELREILDCSIITFHTPLYSTGKHATFHWLDQEKLSTRNFKLVINTSRGGVIDEQALMQSMDAGRVDEAIIDVWENEPVFNDSIAQKAFIATPHIAGYSIQAKFRATKMIIDQMNDFFSLNLPVKSLEETREQICFSDPKKENLSLAEVLTTIHPIKNYGTALSKLVGKPVEFKRKNFNRLRTSMPYRNEYAFLEIPDLITSRFSILKQLGID